MEYTIHTEKVLARLGMETLKLQSAEERIAVLDLALAMACGEDLSGTEADLFAAAAGELERRNQAKSVLAEPSSPPDTEAIVEGKGRDESKAGGNGSST